MKFGAFLVAAAAAQYAGDGNVSIIRDIRNIRKLNFKTIFSVPAENPVLVQETEVT